MEATGDYWKPFFYLLEDAGFEVMLVNARQVKNLPGRKSDVSDATWLAQLGAHGLVRGSFVPPEPIRQLRDLTRSRTMMTRERGREIDKAGGTGSDDPAAGEAAGGCRHQVVQRGQRHHRGVGPFQAFCALVCRRSGPAASTGTIPGIGQRCAEVIVAETGADMSVFPTAAHLASWAGTCPSGNESAGRVKSTATRPGNAYLKAALGASALSIANSHDTYLAAKYRRIAARRGPKKAIVAVEHAILTAIWTMAHTAAHYDDPGADYYTRRDPERLKRHAMSQLHRLGYDVTLTPLAATA